MFAEEGPPLVSFRHRFNQRHNIDLGFWRTYSVVMYRCQMIVTLNELEKETAGLKWEEAIVQTSQ